MSVASVLCARSRRLSLSLWPLLASLAALGASTDDANAVVMGRESSLGYHMVRVSSRSGAQCSGVAIGRALVVTAAHCGPRSVRAGGNSIGARTLVRSAVLDDGRQVSVSGDAVIMKLSSPLPAAISPVTVGEGSGDSYTIAGFGAVSERHRGSMGALHEASLVTAGQYALVDPTRNSSISASACYGDSGGPVLRGSTLVGVISRASHPSPRIACGHITRWAPVMVSGTPDTATVSYAGARETADIQPDTRPHRLKQKRAKRNRL